MHVDGCLLWVFSSYSHDPALDPILKATEPSAQGSVDILCSRKLQCPQRTLQARADFGAFDMLPRENAGLLRGQAALQIGHGMQKYYANCSSRPPLLERTGIRPHGAGGRAVGDVEK